MASFSSLSAVGQLNYYVNGTTGDNSYDGLLPVYNGTHGPKQTIQAGVDVAGTGDIVNVAAGTYVEHVNITKTLTLRGESKATTIIQAPADFATNAAYDYSLSSFVTERTMVHVGTASSINVTIRKFTVDGNRLGPGSALSTVAYSGILAEKCSLTVDSCTIKNVLPADSAFTYHVAFNGRGVHVRGSGSLATITNNTLLDINRFHILVNATDTSSTLPAVFPQGIVTNNTITGKGVYDGAQKGIWFNQGAWGTISSNTISALDYWNPIIESDRATAITIRRGFLNSSQRNIITQNTVSAPSFTNNKGIFDEGIKDSVADNTVTGYRFGIQIHNADSAKALRNTVSGGQIGFMVSRTRSPLVGAWTVTIGGSPENKNTITGQTSAASGGFGIALGFRDELADGSFLSTVPVDARYNDWGVTTEAEVQEKVWDKADSTLADLDTVYYYPFFPFVRASVKAFLEGPYDDVDDDMTKGLNDAGTLDEHFAGKQIPAQAIDSITVEIRDEATAASSTIRRFQPAWLLTDGSIRNFEDTTRSYLEFVAPLGDYYVVVWHRNHLGIMTAAIQSLADAVPTAYDFSTSMSQAYGLTPMIAVGSRFGMIAGDGNGDGGVDALDRNITWLGQNGTAGYLGADFNLDGGADAIDVNTIWRLNNGTGTQVP
ncbi:MAG: right-handed parallel beta-helix repeat-containing protein [Ignavibacteriae bacterium]|nr:right-handed parallel beta-helix repeat-containing protein [Ignavibacteriota bacterium]